MLTLAAPAAAQSAADRAAAETLFQDALRLMEAGRDQQACPKLAESQRLDPAIGTLLYLAECHERVGRLASAWATFHEVEGLAKQAGQTDRERIAQKRAAQLLPRLHKLVIDVSPPHPPGLEVRRDQSILGAASLGVSFPVDAGTHVVDVRADGRKPFSKTVQIPVEPGETRVLVPALDLDDARPPAPPASTSAAAPTGSTHTVATASGAPNRDGAPPSTAAYVAGGIGVAGLLVGSYFGVRAANQWSSSNAHCPTEGCDDVGADKASQAKRSATWSTVGFAVGVVGVGVGVTLWATSRRERSVAVGPSGIALRGAF